VREQGAVKGANGLEFGEPKPSASKRRAELPASTVEVLRVHLPTLEGRANPKSLVFPSLTADSLTAIIPKRSIQAAPGASRTAGLHVPSKAGSAARRAVLALLGFTNCRTIRC
jgi:hypothetical protein